MNFVDESSDGLEIRLYDANKADESSSAFIQLAEVAGESQQEIVAEQ